MRVFLLFRSGVSLWVKLIACLIIALIAYLTPTTSYACCSVTTGPVKSIGYLTNGIFFFSLDAQSSNAPACNSQKRFALNTTVAAEKTLMVLVLASQANGTTLQIVGLQTCRNWQDSEDVGSVASM